MLDPARPQPVDLSSQDSYIMTCLRLAASKLNDFASVNGVAEQEDELNRYPRLESLATPKEVFVVDDASVDADDRQHAVDALLRGDVLMEHTCAGEATRLGLGTKYLINPAKDLTPAKMKELLGDDFFGLEPQALAPLSLGRRHMLQLAWDLSQLAAEYGLNPEKVLSLQTLLIVVNDKTADEIIDDFSQASFYGFDRENVLFMVQKAFHGIVHTPEGWAYDTSSPARLHNHGQMLMQTTMDRQIFRLDESGGKDYLSWHDYRSLLEKFEDKISFNIEDLDYLTQSLDIEGLAAALKLGTQGYRMIMEVVTNNPDFPQKGGSCSWDPVLMRNVMVESFQLKGVENKDITHLNKNINHYPKPVEAISAVREQGLSMPFAVKEGCLYFQPVQGDLNFLVKTAFISRANVSPISAWKSGQNTPDALAVMYDQEQRPGFLTWASKLTGMSL